MSARQWRAIAVAALVAALPAQIAAPAVAGVAITVRDVDRSREFFTEVLGFRAGEQREASGEAHEHVEGVFGVRIVSLAMHLGDESVLLRQFLAPEGRPVPDDSRSADLWFQHVAIVVSDMDAAYAHMRRHRVRHASAGPQTLPSWNAAAGGIRAFYFKDPDGHVLELIRFPPGKGEPRWQRRDALFLGIDHTAIVVRDTEASLAFWRDAVGLRVAGGSENWGPEQERLNNVFGARLRITTLRGASGPGIELLEYLAPGGGRARPVDMRANDLACWQTVLAAPDLAAAEHRLRTARAALVSPGIVADCDCDPACAPTLSVTDPDGHSVRLRAGPPATTDR